MSSAQHHDHAQHDDHGSGFPHGSKRDYVTGFVLSVILTVIPFGVVMAGGLGSARMTAFLVLACAVIQMVVHMVYFLHMTPRTGEGWPAISLAFTLILLVIVVIGTIWVMYHMDANMMPGMTPPAQTGPTGG